MNGSIQVKSESLLNHADTLRDSAGELQTKKFDLFVVDGVKPPASHDDVASAIRKFASFAHDQYQDAVALLVALSTRLQQAAGKYEATDKSVEQAMHTIITKSRFLPADQRVE
ncbi:MAG TPA: type VII secretion target [Micromonospora sp.]